MSNMEVETPTSVIDCSERLRKCSEIEGYSIVAKNYEGLDKIPDPAENQVIKEILRIALEETLQKKVNLNQVLERERESNVIIKPTDSTNNPKNIITKTKGKNKKRKIKKDSSEDQALRVEGFLVRGVAQCYNCKKIYHKAENCHLKPRCLKFDSDHPTKQCPIKEKQDNPYCINCQEYGHTACYIKFPKFPKPKKELAPST
ncbi:hypothetical protein TNCV_3167301 [Trichonephila clavipes]|uniref:Gag-like protein n=1 Tax=Trichonephila clavipes TaxID=2585209 RepID=A0A8X6V2M1_TRICX|nr:hypothetical protein TNCV_3167301 [Trichonephila clavipes]